MRLKISPSVFAQRRILTSALVGLSLTSVLSLPTGAASGPAPAPPATPLSAVAQIGREMFTDTTLSGNGQMSCATCHDPANHYGPDGRAPVAMGGPDLSRSGLRAVPMLTYDALTPAFTVGPLDPSLEANEASPQAVAAHTGPSAQTTAAPPQAPTGPAPQKIAGQTTLAAPVPRGGQFWDGRADTLADQARGPLLTRFEMANTVPHLAQTLRTRYGARLAALFGPSILDDDQMLISEATFALARYQVEDPSFHPFSSKYDAYLAGKTTLSPAEARGLALFNDPQKGNCAACHLDTPATDGAAPLFTDFEFEALGVPRNPALPQTRDPNWFDLGLCGPLRTDAMAHDPAYCGMFKTPSLRNVAARQSFFHNGVYHSLKDVVDFYAKRDSTPEAIYPMKNGKLQVFNDLPARYRGNIDYADAPFDRSPAQGPALSDAEEDDIVAFLKTLTDGYTSGPR
ncbi:c-type cytochrome [Thioclava sp. BHET1]|nr:c-type cytochrome [Thioclava sp. BHET1]